MPFVGMIEIIAHEVSHVVAGFEKGHGQEWEDVFEIINQEFNRINIEAEM